MKRIRGWHWLASAAFGSAFLAALPDACVAQPAENRVVSGTRRDTIVSRVLGEQRIVDVTLPRRYDTEEKARYPVVVVLDGEFEGEIAAATARFYASTGVMPPVIVVAVHNTARMRDLTPAAVQPFVAPPGVSGGADRFLEFLSSELVPHVEQRYRTAPMRVVVGHSLGGLFALHALTKQPELFTGYVVMEPSAWWNQHKPARDATEALARPASRTARVMLVNAQSVTADTTSWGGDRPMVRHLEVSGESHASMAVVGMALAFRRLFEDFRPPQWQPGTSPILMLARYDSLAARVGYQVPVPATAFETIARMAIDSRFFADAETVLSRMERSIGLSEEGRALRARLNTDRNTPVPAGFIPLVIPVKRPTPAQAAPFIGRWRSIDSRIPHEVEIRASGDTIIVRDRLLYPNTQPFEADDPVIRITDAGVLEWGIPVYRGLAALLVQMATVSGDGTMVVRSEPRGWVPRQEEPGSRQPVRFSRIANDAP